MGLGRFAGDALNALMDNAVTRSAQRTIDPLISRVESVGRTPEWLLDAGANRIAYPSGHSAEAVSDKQLQVLRELGGSVDNLRSQIEGLSALPAERGGHIHNVVTGMAEKYAIDPRRLYDLSLAVDSGRPDLGSSNWGNVARQYVVPPAAIAAVAGGTALAVKGAMDVYARIQAGQPVSPMEKAQADEVLKAAGEGR